MNLINVENITKSYTERKLFDKASFYLQEREKVGVIGINGTGKSTLLKMIAGLETPEEGTVTKANHVVVRYLPQNPVFDGEKTVIDTVLTASIQNFVGSNAGDEKNEGLPAKTFLQEQHWTLESDAKAMMTRLGIRDFEQKTGELSGGQKKRLALVAALLVPCDVLILDEPTNHLDSAMADWLEDFLKKWRGALVMITHDRYFLDSVCNRIVEVDKGDIYSYDTNYSGYLELRVQREDMTQASERKRQTILKKELEWVRRGARARTTKQKGRLQRYEELKNQAAPETDGAVEMSSVYARMGKTTIELEGISKSYDDKILLQDFSYIFLKGDRVGFIGANGSGKTTLMKMIAGRLEPDAGSITVGQTIKIGYYTQEIEIDKNAGIAYMNPEERVIDYIKNTAEYVRTTDGLVSASNMLERFLFPSSQQYSPIGKLSGGEKRRLNLLRVLMEAPNVLILDEPTNDLDTRTLAILEDYLDSYEGIVITVSHDRYFLDRVVRRIFAFEENGKIAQYEGGYTDYVNRLAAEGRTPGGDLNSQTGAGVKTGLGISRGQAFAEQQETGIAQNEINGVARSGEVNGIDAGGTAFAGKQDSMFTWKHEKKLKFTYKEQKEYETIEDDIAALEEKLEKLDADMMTNATNSAKLGELIKEKEAAEQQLEEKMERWEYLEELAAKIEAQKICN